MFSPKFNILIIPYVSFLIKLFALLLSIIKKISFKPWVLQAKGHSVNQVFNSFFAA
ncbi:hypothetical protein HMPREF9444_00213 [Succinatimonas hippei YIT 12066]|uniref:Uncharacterized protein n=1 Tax=Succinatimonas hippei (strain DSM 22608 / JCM 16073 / KCTC 15190 / YIT 12066) TaxID=762983 RepID=E8LHP3_SUCHY|nr:hypothetical protein HMPREF9444_00213 [Succinatimonas hippei YIT 12066]